MRSTTRPRPAAWARAGPSCASRGWPRCGAILDEARLALPADSAFRSTGKRGVHSEHMGYILAEMQYLQRAYPGRRVVSALPRQPTPHRRAPGRCSTRVLDPEVPALSVRDLGIVRDVIDARRRRSRSC